MGPKKPSRSKSKSREEDKGKMPEDARGDELAKAGPSSSTPTRTRTQRSAALKASEKISLMNSPRASTSSRPSLSAWSKGEKFFHLTENVGDKDGKSADNTKRSTRASTSSRPTLPPWPTRAEMEASRAEMEARRMALLAESSASAADSKEMSKDKQAENIKKKSTGKQISELTENVGDKDGKSVDNARRNKSSSDSYASSEEIIPISDLGPNTLQCIFRKRIETHSEVRIVREENTESFSSGDGSEENVECMGSHEGERKDSSDEPIDDAAEGYEPDETDKPEEHDLKGYEPDESNEPSDSNSEYNSDDLNPSPSLSDPEVQYRSGRPAKITARRMSIADETAVTQAVNLTRENIYSSTDSSNEESENESRNHQSRRSSSGDRKRKNRS